MRMPILLLIPLTVYNIGCRSPRLAGKTVRETFSETSVIKLTQAAIHGDKNTITRLANSSVVVNTKGELDITPLLWAVLTKNLNGVEALLAIGADPNQKTLNGRPPLSWAASLNQPKLLALLLEHGANPNGLIDSKINDRPLVIAAYDQHIENVKLLLAAGADINIHDQFDANAADTACSQGSFEIVAYLLDHGYSFQLNSLAQGVQIRHVPPDSDQQHWKDRVIEQLKSKGVTWPPIPSRPKNSRGVH